MAGSRSLQSVAVGAALVAAGLCVVLSVRDPTPSLRHPAVLVSAHAAVGAWYAACVSMLLSSQRFALVYWTLGAALHLLHVALALGLGHGWSHAAAVRHVAATGGFGWGIVVNYLFAAVWLADAAWWWANPAGYAARPRWVGRGVHGFLAFVVVSATVVFGTVEVRAVYGVLFVVLAVLWRVRASG